MSRLQDAFSYNGYETSAPLSEVAKNTRISKDLLCDIKTEVASLNTTINEYNTNQQFILTDTQTVTLPANTYHSYSFTIISGSVDITEGGVTLSNAPQGYFGGMEATTLLSNSVVFVGKSVGTLVVIKTIK